MDGVGTSIVGRSRRLSADRRARPTYTLIWEEPPNDWTGDADQIFNDLWPAVTADLNSLGIGSELHKDWPI